MPPRPNKPPAKASRSTEAGYDPGPTLFLDFPIFGRRSNLRGNLAHEGLHCNFEARQRTYGPVSLKLWEEGVWKVDEERSAWARLVCWDQRVEKFLAQTRQNSSPKSAPRNGLASLSTSLSNRVVDQIEDGRDDLRGPDWQPPAYPETGKVIAITQIQHSQ